MAVAVRSLEAEAYPHSAVDSGTAQCGGPKGESDAPVAILGETCCIVSDGDAARLLALHCLFACDLT